VARRAWQTANGKAETRPQLREINFLRPFDAWQFAALEDEDAVWILGENTFC